MDTEYDHPILRKEVEAASLKKGKSAEVDNIQAELVEAGGEDVIAALTTICNKIWLTGEWPNPWTQSLVITLPIPRLRFKKKKEKKEISSCALIPLFMPGSVHSGPAS